MVFRIFEGVILLCCVWMILVFVLNLWMSVLSFCVCFFVIKFVLLSKMILVNLSWFINRLIMVCWLDGLLLSLWENMVFILLKFWWKLKVFIMVINVFNLLIFDRLIFSFLLLKKKVCVMGSGLEIFVFLISK